MSAGAFVLVTLALAGVVHVAFVLAFPYLIMPLVRRAARLPDNVLTHMPPTTAESRAVVRPSPDLLYSACPFNVSKAPLHIRATVPASYWSISFFASNTDNFFVMNDRQVDGREAEFVLVGKGQAGPVGSGIVVEAQSNRGVVLIRMLVERPEAVADLIAVQKLAYAAPLPR